MKIVVRVLCLFTAIAVSACTSMRIEDLFSGYTQQMTKVIAAQKQGNFQQALNELPVLNKNHNHYNLNLLEQGRLHYLKADYSLSQTLFEQAYTLIEQQNNKAKLQISRGLENVGAVMSNDSAIGYIVPAYEQSMLHSFQSVNFAFQDKLESAMVEIRRANLVQEAALKNNEAELLNAQNDLTQQGLSLPDLYSSYPSMDDTIGNIKNGFQNAYTFYLSAVFYEATGELDNAYIDYKRAIDIFPGNTFLQQDILRLAKQLNRKDELARFSQQFGKEERLNSLNEKQSNIQNFGQVIVFFEQGTVANKQEIDLNLPIYTRHGDLRFFSFALPVYRSENKTQSPLLISSGENSWHSENIVNLQSLASKTLKEQLPAMVTRQALRLIAKEEFRRKMQKEGGDIGNILSSLYNIASEKADTRSWLTLPDNIQIARFNLPVGAQKLSFRYGTNDKNLELIINKERFTIINISSSGLNTSIQHIEI